MKKEELIQFLTLVFKEKGIDLSQYKESTLCRRLQSRVQYHGFKDLFEYAVYLKKQPEEYKELFNSLYINVTEFFRNTESFEVLEKKILPDIIKLKKEKGHRIVRVWCCACAGGDEPYSIAMLFSELLKKETSRFLVNIYGTDVDAGAIKEAEKGEYQYGKITNIPKIILKEYFDKIDDDKYRIKSNIRAMVRFRQSDVIQDEPVKYCDLILCRNLLIYFNKELQEETLLKFHSSLAKDGYLVLGMVETMIGNAVRHYKTIDNRNRIYQHKELKDIQKESKMLMSQEDIDKLIKQMTE